MCFFFHVYAWYVCVVWRVCACGHVCICLQKPEVSLQYHVSGIGHHLSGHWVSELVFPYEARLPSQRAQDLSFLAQRCCHIKLCMRCWGLNAVPQACSASVFVTESLPSSLFLLNVEYLSTNYSLASPEKAVKGTLLVKLLSSHQYTSWINWHRMD